MKRFELNRFTPIKIEWNCYNGFIFTLLSFDPRNFTDEYDLFGLEISPEFMYITILFVRIKIFDKTELTT